METSKDTSTTTSNTDSSNTNTQTDTKNTKDTSTTSTTTTGNTAKASTAKTTNENTTETNSNTSTTESSTAKTEPTSESTSTKNDKAKESETTSNSETNKPTTSSTAQVPKAEVNSTPKSEEDTNAATVRKPVSVKPTTDKSKGKLKNLNTPNKVTSISTANKIHLEDAEKQLTPREEKLMELKKHGIDMEKIMEVQKTPEMNELLDIKELNVKAIGQVTKQGNLGTILEFGKKFKETEKVAKDLGDYIYSIGGVNNPEEYVRATYGVYLSISNVLTEKDFGKFNMKFRYLIGVICNAKKEAKADELTFLKHDTSWKWGNGEFKKFHSLITTMFTACDKGIKNVGKVVDLEKVVADLPASAKANVKAFFTK